jgi:F-type H+-transporting ATPase subunit alpha
MTEQIAVLLALSEKLFDSVPLAQMTAAEQAVREAAADIPIEVCARLDSADKLGAEDRASIISIASHALAGFQPKQGHEEKS